MVALPVHVAHEVGFKVKVTHLIAPFIEIEETIKPTARFACYKGAYGTMRLESATGANTNNFKGFELGINGA